MDDNRTTGPDYESAWKASTDLAKGYSFLGIQDASRKRRSPTKEPGPWVVTILSTVNGVMKSLSAERWAKTKHWLAEIRKGYNDWLARPDARGGLDRHLLERARGFLVYVARAYTPLRPYLKGIHLTIDGWRPDRDDDWRSSSLREWWLERNEGAALGDLEPPERVIPVSRALFGSPGSA